MSDSQHNSLLPQARKLRRDMTPQERKLWYLFLRGYPVEEKPPTGFTVPRPPLDGRTYTWLPPRGSWHRPRQGAVTERGACGSCRTK